MPITFFAFLFENLNILVSYEIMKRKTIRNHRDFLTMRETPTAHADCFVVKAKSAKFENDARFGLVASKKTFKLAVHRNRAKRLLRDWVAFNEDLMLPDMDYVFVARAQILDCKREEGRAQMAKALKKIAKMQNEN